MDHEPTEQMDAKILGWEQLVTEGHVRAARIRRLNPLLLGLGLILAAYGGLKLSTTQRPETSIDPVSVVTARAAGLRQRALEPLVSLEQPPQVANDEIADLPPAEELTALIAAVLAGLNESDKLPSEIQADIVDPAAFFAAAWPVSRLLAVESEGLIALGGIVKVPGRRRGFVPLRWVGIFRRTETGWLSYTLAGRTLYKPEDQKLVDPGKIALSLNQLMGREEV